MKQQKQSAIAQRAEQLGTLTYEERRHANRDQHIKQVFKYIDEQNNEYISCAQFSKFLNQAGVLASEQSIYDLVLQQRGLSDKEDKPLLNAIAIKEEEFREILLIKGMTAPEISEVKQAFAQLAQITPGLLNQSNNLITNQLWAQMKHWGIMDDAEIEQVKPFFGTGGKQSDSVAVDRFLDGMLE